MTEPEHTRINDAERKRLEEHVQDLSALIGALVRKYGEQIGTSTGPVWRASLTEQERMDAMGGTLQTMLDPVSGALLIRFRPE